MNEKRIEQVLEIERQAQGILDAATHEADQLPAKAEQEAAELLQRARAEAQEQAGQLVAKAQADEESAAIISKAEEQNRETEKTASRNTDKAVAFVLERVIGKG